MRLPLARRVVEVVDAGHIDEDFKAQAGIVAQRDAYLLEIRGLNLVTQFIGKRRRTLHQPRKTGFDLGRERRDFFGLGHGHARAMVLVRSIFFCNWMIPYNSASAVGGHPGT